MADIDHRAELARAGAFVEGWWGSILFFIRRYPLGAAGAGTTVSSTGNNSRRSMLCTPGACWYWAIAASTLVPFGSSWTWKP